jgi:hypothetical protein
MMFPEWLKSQHIAEKLQGQVLVRQEFVDG